MSIEILSLCERADETSCATLPVANELVRCLALLIESADSSEESEALLQDLRRQGTALAGARGRSALETLTQPLMSTCQAAVAAVQHGQQMRRQDIAGLLSIIRDTVESLAKGHERSAADMDASTMRLEQMKDVGNVFQLKQMLAQEVITLRTLATDRERERAQVVGRLREQLVLAKTQLTVARNEAATDAVTGVTNRRGFDRSLADYYP